MSDYLITLASIVFIFVLPGLSLIRIFHLRIDNLVEWILYSIALSFAMIVMIGFALANTVGINIATVIFAFIVASLAGLRSITGWVRTVFNDRSKYWKIVGSCSERINPRLLLGGILVAAVTAFNWSSAIGTHAIDMGEHVYWAKVIISTERLPNYLSVEPLDQAVKFTYGAHLMLAQFFLVGGVPIEEYSWIPTLVGSIAILCAILQITYRITLSKWAALIGALLYGSASQPFGYIERGNLPDIAGYLLLVSTVYSILRVRKTPSFSYAIGLTSVSVIPTHQLATVILPLLLLFTVTYSYFRSRSDLTETVRSIFGNRIRSLYWGLILLLAVGYAGTTTYVSSSAATQLITGNWRPYVPALYDDILVPGATLGFLAIAGIAVAVTRRAIGFMLLLGWTTSLVFLTNALLIGIPIPDPLRFLWRLTEPFSILGAVFVSWLLSRLRTAPDTNPKLKMSWIKHNKISFLGISFLTLILAVQIAGLAVPALEGAPNVFSLPPRYRPVEAFYQDDKQIGLWLATNASPTAVTTNDADVDPTATWVQTYSMKLHFLYRADFATIVAPANYIQIYRGMAVMYESPNDARVPLIIQQFNITYVVAHTDEIALFSSATCFGHAPVFTSGDSALFKTEPC